MDITTIRTKLREGKYQYVNEVLSDIELIWDNAFIFNAGNESILQCTREISTYYNNKLRELKFSLD